ncbi:hypothetical protein, partial [Bacteroides cellulosilyticus]|uniref:hypothetical protein n=1 Tax=Bacteroides cellulosilyticus TaxID=246787 RepID=UPI0032F00F83
PTIAGQQERACPVPLSQAVAAGSVPVTKRFKSSIYNFSQKNPLQGIKRAQYFPHYILSLQCHQK